jgi:hypothetical protein
MSQVRIMPSCNSVKKPERAKDITSDIIADVSKLIFSSEFIAQVSRSVQLGDWTGQFPNSTKLERGSSHGAVGSAGTDTDPPEGAGLTGPITVFFGAGQIPVSTNRHKASLAVGVGQFDFPFSAKNDIPTPIPARIKVGFVSAGTSSAIPISMATMSATSIAAPSRSMPLAPPARQSA